jgi:hypothetical protein
MLVGYMQISNADGSQVLDMQRDTPGGTGVARSQPVCCLRA